MLHVAQVGRAHASLAGCCVYSMHVGAVRPLSEEDEGVPARADPCSQRLESSKSRNREPLPNPIDVITQRSPIGARVQEQEDEQVETAVSLLAGEATIQGLLVTEPGLCFDARTEGSGADRRVPRPEIAR